MFGTEYYWRSCLTPEQAAVAGTGRNPEQDQGSWGWGPPSDGTGGQEEEEEEKGRRSEEETRSSRAYILVTVMAKV